MTEIANIEDGSAIVNDLVVCIVNNRDYLSEIDGAIGDGDHGINMAKGFNICKHRIEGKNLSLAAAFETLSDSLMEGIGGSMGPLYGSIFGGWAEAIQDKQTLNSEEFKMMLLQGLHELQEISNAKKGDKCLLDSLLPAIEAFSKANEQDKTFKEALIVMKEAATQGKDSTHDLVAKIGRASRLGERSKGVLDAGATSCCLLLNQLADSIQQRI